MLGSFDCKTTRHTNSECKSYYRMLGDALSLSCSEALHTKSNDTRSYTPAKKAIDKLKAGYTLLHTGMAVGQERMTPGVWTSHQVINLQGEEYGD